MKVPRLHVGAFPLLLLSLMASTSTCVEGNCRILAFRAPSFFINKRLVNHTIGKKESVDDIEICKRHCYYEDNCVSVNYDVDTKTCELNNATHRRHDNEFRNEPNYLYHAADSACEEINCDNGRICQSGFTVKGYRCVCPSGFKGEHCEKDINECVTGEHNCDANRAYCNNTKGSFACLCKPGYTGDGLTCIDINECVTGEHNCDANRAYCNNTKGSFACLCKPGYTGDGLTCTDVDECTQESHDCLQGVASCSNTNGSYNCTCQDGYIGDGRTVCEFSATFTCDNEMEIFADGKSLGKDREWTKPTTYLVPANTRVLSVAGKDTGSQFGIIGSTSHGLVTNETWKCSSVLSSGWNSPDFDDQDWPLAKVIANHGDKPWKTIDGIAKTAKWIWANNNEDSVYCTLKLK